MSVKLDKQPLCRYCGKPIRKRTEWVYVHETAPKDFTMETKPQFVDGHHEFVETGRKLPIHVSRHVVGVFRDKDELQRHINEKIVSVRRSSDGTISQVGVWDGETYEDAYFDKNTCAISFAGLYVRLGHATTTYNKALGKLNATQKT